jgi:XTP/dITP diphosphohydrolase
MDRLLATLRALRAPDGCPWDREQTHESLRPHLLEEAAEAVDALAAGRAEEVVEELGDVLMQVAFHAVIAEEAGRWGYDDVERVLVEKLVRRHPHVFGDDEAADAAAVEATWARVKAQERGGGDPDDPAETVPRSLPALERAAALAKALAWAPPEPALRRAADGGDDDETLADALLALAVRAARGGRSPEVLLRDAVARRLAARQVATDDEAATSADAAGATPP